MKLPTKQNNMGTVDIYLLKVLSDNQLLTLSDIVIKFQQFEDLDEVPTRTALYNRLTILEEKKKFVDTEWEEGNKFYKICNEGKERILKISKHLTQVFK